MKIIIFAGGAGTRLWPMSRKNSPKQFGQIFNGKSTLQLTVERVEAEFGIENVYVSTNEAYVSIVKEQLPQIPSVNIIAEPEKRDVAPAVGFNFIALRKGGYSGPVAILWADHLMKRVDEFVWALRQGEKLIKKDPKRFILLSERPRYAENNLGWIHIGADMGDRCYEFKGWKYRPPMAECKQMFESGEWFWNPGYWVVDLDFTLSLYEKYMPEMYAKLLQIEASIGTVSEAGVIRKLYPSMEKITFDNAIMEKVPSSQAVVLTPNMGWSDPGTLYALKESLSISREENVERGLLKVMDSKDCLIINEEKGKLMTAIGLEGMIVVNTKDAIIVLPKEEAIKVKDLVAELEENKKLQKYI
jgi:mannose-1-phosphate guanylyltransferase